MVVRRGIAISLVAFLTGVQFEVHLDLLNLLTELLMLLITHRCIILLLNILVATLVIIRGSWSLGTTLLVRKVSRLVGVQNVLFNCC
jgi:hypothetical protein